MTRHGKYLAKSLLAVTAAVLALVLVEIIVRVSGAAPDVIPIFITSDDGMCRRSANHHLSFEMKPNYRNDHSDCRSDFPRINADGLRDTERSMAKPAGVRRVVLLGDSVVVGFGIRRIDDLMSRQLERLYASGSVEVLNMAVTGYCTRAEVELLKVQGLHYDPDEVVLVFVENDFDNFNRQARGIGGAPSRPALAKAMYRHWDLFRLASIRLNWFGYGVEMDPLTWNHRAVGDNNVVDGLRVLKQLADRHGFGVSVAVWPTFYNDAIIDKDKMRVPGGSRDLIIERLAWKHGFPVCRMSEHFHEIWQAQAPQENPRLRYTIGDEMHPSEEGHRVAALILKDVLDGKRVARPRSAGAPDAAFQLAADAARERGDEEANYALDHMDRAKRLAAEGKLDEAIAEYQRAMDINEKYAVNAHHDIGLLMLGKGQVEEAIYHFRQSLKHKPDFHVAHTNLGHALLEQHNVDKAIVHYREALQARPEYAPAHNSLAEALQAQGNIQTAIKHFRRAAILSARETNFKAFGLALAHSGQLEEAIKQFTNAITLDPQDGEAHFHLGRGYRQAAALAKSLEHLHRARQLAPQNASVHNSIGITLMRMGRRQEAIEAFSEALRLDPRFELARKNLQNAQSLAP